MDLAMRDARAVADVVGEVALVRDPDQLIRQPQRRDDFRGRRQQRDYAHAAAPSASSKSAKTNPSRSTIAPQRKVTGRSNIGPAQQNVWNSPFSPQGSTRAGSRSSRDWSNV